MISLRSILLAFLGLCLAATIARAGELSTVNIIEDKAFEQVFGVALINGAAGDSNLQYNGAAIAVSEAGAALATVTAIQHLDGEPGQDLKLAVVRIEGRAFSRAEGLISVNQAGGQYNMQANLVAIALGVEGEIVAEADLSQSRSTANPPDDVEPDGARQASVDDRAFEDAAGVVQVNQAAGLGNSLFNRFALSLSASPNP